MLMSPGKIGGFPKDRMGGNAVLLHCPFSPFGLKDFRKIGDIGQLTL